MLTPTDLQRQTLRLYGELVSRRESWGGKLVFAFGEGVCANGLPAAVSIAGGTTLVLDPDAATVKSAFRQGGIDFVVNTLDEALRILKNELRKHTPVSVGLIAAISPTLDEMAERGVRPDLQISIAAREETLAPPAGQAGMLELSLGQLDGAVEPTRTTGQWLESRGWSERVLTAPTTAALRALDAEILAMETLDPIRLHWMRRIAHYQRTSAEAGRVLWLAPAELFHLEAFGTSAPPVF